MFSTVGCGSTSLSLDPGDTMPQTMAVRFQYPGTAFPSLIVTTDGSSPKNPFVVLVKLNKGGNVISYFTIMVWPREAQDLGG